MDVRVLVAVFVTLLAVAVGMNQGHIDADDLMDQLRDLRGEGGSLFDALQERNRQASNISVRARLDTTETVALNLRTSARVRLTLKPGTRLSVGDSSLTTADRERVGFDRFTGTVAMQDGIVNVTGRAWGVSTGTIAFNYSSDRAVRVQGAEASSATLQWVSRQDLQFTNVTGSVEASGPEISLRHDSAVLNTFLGNITVTRENRYLFAGTVSKAVLGTGTPPVVIGPE